MRLGEIKVKNIPHHHHTRMVVLILSSQSRSYVKIKHFRQESKFYEYRGEDLKVFRVTMTKAIIDQTN